MSDINAAIKEAQAAAGEIIDAEVENLPAPQTQAPAPAHYQKPSMETMGTITGINNSVDMWLKVSENGLKIGTEKGLVDQIEVDISMVEDEGFFVKQSIKWGSPVTYASSYDGVTSDKGGNWGAQVQFVNQIEPKAKPFPSADIIMVLKKHVKIKDKTIPAGTKLGHTLSMSNWQNWALFYQEVAKLGKIGETVSVKIVADEVNGSNGFTWGVIIFDLA